MISSRHKRGLGVAATAASLGLIFAALPAGAALADPSESSVITDTVEWTEIDQELAAIGEANALSDWTHDAFDTFGRVAIASVESDERFTFNGGDSVTRTETPGGATFTFQQRHEWADAQISTIDVTLTIKGSFARWNVTVTGGPATRIEIQGNLGSDSQTRYTDVGTGRVADDRQTDTDPVLGFNVTTNGTFNGWTSNVNSPGDGDDLTATVTGSDMALTVVIGDFSPCGFEEAREFIASITPKLDSVFGTAYAPIGSCFSVPAQTITVGEAIELRIPVVFPSETDPQIFAQGATSGVSVSGLPAGLTGAIEYGADNLPILHIAGTATTAGPATAVLAFAGVAYPNTSEPTFAAQRAVIAPGIIKRSTLAANVEFTVLAPALKTVTFNSNGGSTIAPITTAPGTGIAAPAAPSKTGYTFTGWFADAASSAFNFANPITSDITLTARWAVNSYTVTFDSNGGSAVAALTAEYGSTVAAPAVPARPGYIFEGWFADAATKAFSFATPIGENVTLTARWSAAPANTTASQSAVAGQEVPVTGKGFIPGQTVEVWLHSTPVKLGTLTVAANGTVRGSFALPAATPAGQHHIVFVDEAGVEHRSGTITVAAAPVVSTPTPTATAPATATTAIASTGANAAGPLQFALALLLIGAAVIGIRRHKAHTA